MRAEKVEPIQFRTGIRKTESCHAQERTATKCRWKLSLGSGTVSRPELSCRVSKLQSATSKATIKDLILANKTVEDAKEYSSHGLYFRDWNQAVFVAVSVASWAKEMEMVRGIDQKPESTNEHPEMILLYPLGWASTVV